MNLVGPSRLWIALAIAAAACSQPATTASTSSPATSTTASPETTETQSTTSQPATQTTSAPSPRGALVFHKTAGFRHESIGAGIEALQELADNAGYEATVTDDASVFSSTGLAPFTLIVFLNTTGDVLDDPQQQAMEEFIRAGHGFVGIHSAADTEYDWDWYGGLVGAYFDSHPEPQSATVAITVTHSIVDGLPESFERFDEWYNFRTMPPSEAAVLATIDESTYQGGTMGESHPIVWAQDYDGGRSVYIGFGHTPETFAEPLMRELLGNAIAWAGTEPGEGD